MLTPIAMLAGKLIVDEPSNGTLTFSKDAVEVIMSRLDRNVTSEYRGFLYEKPRSFLAYGFVGFSE
jgi:hypothetical protein